MDYFTPGSLNSVGQSEDSAWEQFDLNPLWARAASHTLDPMLRHGDENKDFSNALVQRYHPFLLPLFVSTLFRCGIFVFTVC